ncbi:hypothetical protein SAMN04489745_0433 [Arthrobacter woluwensis]|uniref:Uncharacterized protein n=2 Tax=Arthrobacter woluwensis TaxID=156980 RepID=A0A1H4JXM1_9MICC|nr:hypothetical protein SAMN04489745_0433 [Arthrobacter woluwensis]
MQAVSLLAALEGPEKLLSGLVADFANVTRALRSRQIISALSNSDFARITTALAVFLANLNIWNGGGAEHRDRLNKELTEELLEMTRIVRAAGWKWPNKTFVERLTNGSADADASSTEE